MQNHPVLVVKIYLFCDFCEQYKFSLCRVKLQTIVKVPYQTAVVVHFALDLKWLEEIYQLSAPSRNRHT